MSEFIVQKAKRLKLKARIGLTGPTNCGKTYSALVIAKGLLQSEKLLDENGQPDWSKVCVIDSERKRSLFYVNNGVFGEFMFIEMTPPYSPKRYIEATQAALDAGAKVIIIDSLSHAWSGTGGVLQIVSDRTANSRTKNSYSDGWGGTDGGTAIQNQMIDYLMAIDAHLICTFRSKMDSVMEKDEGTGRTVIKRLGIKPDQRGDLEYEFDITLQFDKDTHKPEIIKNTVQFIDESSMDVLTEEFGKNLGDYLAQGIDPETIKQAQLEHARKTIVTLMKENPNNKAIYDIYAKGQNLKDITDLNLLNTIIRKVKE